MKTPFPILTSQKPCEIGLAENFLDRVGIRTSSLTDTNPVL